MMKTTLMGACLAAALSTLPATANPLSAQDIYKLAPGTYRVSVLGLTSLTISFQPDGSVSGVKKNGKRDTGIWTIRGSQLCIQWKRWVKGKTRCSTISGANGRYSGAGLSIRKI